MGLYLHVDSSVYVCGDKHEWTAVTFLRTDPVLPSVSRWHRRPCLPLLWDVCVCNSVFTTVEAYFGKHLKAAFFGYGKYCPGSARLLRSTGSVVYILLILQQKRVTQMCPFPWFVLSFRTVMYSLCYTGIETPVSTDIIASPPTCFMFPVVTVMNKELMRWSNFFFNWC